MASQHHRNILPGSDLAAIEHPVQRSLAWSLALGLAASACGDSSSETVAEGPGTGIQVKPPSELRRITLSPALFSESPCAPKPPARWVSTAASAVAHLSSAMAERLPPAQLRISALSNLLLSFAALLPLYWRYIVCTNGIPFLMDDIGNAGDFSLS